MFPAFESVQPEKLAILRDRAAMLSKVRAYFQKGGVLEVDTPILSPRASVDAHIDLISAYPSDGQRRFLHSSPEYGMKRLLAAGSGDIYQMSHVFRDSEQGHLHNPEFTMIEWYRVGLPFSGMIEETLKVIRLFLGELPATTLSYRDAFLQFTGLDYSAASLEELRDFLYERGLNSFSSFDTRDSLLNYILGVCIEPHLGRDGLTVLAYYPSSQAALARTCWHKEELVSERFEVYCKGIELANGYHELADAQEQRLRLLEANELREAQGKEALPLDEHFLEALELGLPDCCGVAVGFDRLMMLRHGLEQIGAVMPFGWSDA